MLLEVYLVGRSCFVITLVLALLSHCQNFGKLSFGCGHTLQAAALRVTRHTGFLLSPFNKGGFCIDSSALLHQPSLSQNVL